MQVKEHLAGKKGFARLSLEKRAEIAAKGGRAAHAKGNAHQFTSEEARKAGAIGGRRISQDREYMSKIGAVGGGKGKGRGKKRAAKP